MAEHKITKRGILFNITRLIDLLGLLGPVIVIAKILMQQLWKLKINWDDYQRKCKLSGKNIYRVWISVIILLSRGGCSVTTQ
jgi:hypothetical protein